MQIPDSEIRIEEHIIVFIDVHNYSLAFDDLLESYGFLQEMYETLGDLIVGAGGEIIKYLGDSILSVFPAGYAVQAVACAQQMRQVFAAMVANKGLPEEIVLEVGIGAGQIVVGVCGHRTLRQKDIFGEEINRVARIGHYRGVAITEPVYEQIKASYQTRRLPDLATKKVDQLLRVWAVVE